MAVIGEFPVYDLDYDDIRDTLNRYGGPVTNNAETAFVSANKGGSNGYAYNVVGANTGKDDGVLIEGAVPCHNIYSPKGPSEWRLPEIAVGTNNVNPVYNRIKRDSNDKYTYNFENFYSYNPTANKFYCPSMRTLRVQYSGLYNQVTVSFRVEVNLGDYDWTSITNSEGKYTPKKFYVQFDNYSKLDKSEMVTITSSKYYSLANKDISIKTDLVTLPNEPIIIPTYVVLCDINGNPLGRLPESGKYEVDILAEPIKAELRINVDEFYDSFFYYKDSLYVNSVSIGGYFGYNPGMNFNKGKARKLVKVEYIQVDRRTNTTYGNPVIHTSANFTLEEFPKDISNSDLENFPSSGKLFKVDAKALLPKDLNYYIRAKMYYTVV